MITLKEGPTLPHERELLEIIGMVMKAYENKEYVGMFVCEQHSHIRHLLGLLRTSTEWDDPHTKLFREGIEVKGGGRVIGMSINSPDRLRGMSVNEIVIFGGLGEFYYCAQAALAKTHGEIRYVA